MLWENKKYLLCIPQQLSHPNEDFHLASVYVPICVCLCVCINGCYRPKSRAGIILSNLLSAGLGISRVLEASLSSLLSSFSFHLPNGSGCFTLSHLCLNPDCVHTCLVLKSCLSSLSLARWLSLPLSLTSLCVSMLCLCLFASFLFHSDRKADKYYKVEQQYSYESHYGIQ